MAIENSRVILHMAAAMSALHVFDWDWRTKLVIQFSQH